jgi:glutamine synthetase
MYKTSYENAALNDHSEKHLKHWGWFLEDYTLLAGTRTEPLNQEVRRHLKKSGIPVENTKGEYGFGQHELNITYSDVLDMSDKHVVYKQCFKEVADKMGYSVTFMAKPHTNQSGSSCHIHINLVNEKDNSNAFVGNEILGDLKCSNNFKYFLGGLMKYTTEIMPFIAPTINSYKRFVSASWAPTRLGWSIDNRTASLRIVGVNSKSLRIECRLPGADANPYLAFAGVLAAGLEGVEKKLEPPPQAKGDNYANENAPIIPLTLEKANNVFSKSSFARSTFGDDVIDHYSHYYLKEVEAFNRNVTDWERKRYFELI